METQRYNKVAQYLAGRTRATIEQVCSGIGIKDASSHDHHEIARAMEVAGRSRKVTGSTVALKKCCWFMHIQLFSYVG
jgi:hypothetical protein